MNWVGGARSRIKRKNNEQKKQREFFKRKRMESAKEFSNINTSGTPGLSRDLLIFNFLQIKSKKSNIVPKPTKIIKQDLEKINYNKTGFINIPETPLDSVSNANKRRERNNVKQDMEDATKFQSQEDSHVQINEEFNKFPESFRRTEKSGEPKIFSVPDTDLQNGEYKLYNPFSYDCDSSCVDSPGSHQKEQVDLFSYPNQEDQQSVLYLPQNQTFHHNESSTGMHKFRENMSKNTRRDMNSLYQNDFLPSVLRSYAEAIKRTTEKRAYTDKLSEKLEKSDKNPSESDFIFKPSPVINNKYLAGNNEDFTSNEIENNSLLSKDIQSFDDNLNNQYFEKNIGDGACLCPSRAYLHSTDFINSPTGNKSSSTSSMGDPENVLHSEISEDSKVKRASKHFDIAKNINKMKSILKPSNALKYKNSRIQKLNSYPLCGKTNLNSCGSHNYEEPGRMPSEMFYETKYNLYEEFDYYSAFQQTVPSVKGSKHLSKSNISRQHFPLEYSQTYNTTKIKNTFDISNSAQSLFRNDVFCPPDKFVSDTETNLHGNEYFTNRMKRNDIVHLDLKTEINKQVKNKKDMATSPILPKFHDIEGKYLNDAIFYTNTLKNPVPSETSQSPILNSRILKNFPVISDRSLNTAQEIGTNKNHPCHTKAFHTVRNDLKGLVLRTPEIPEMQYPVVKDTDLRNLPPTVPNSPSALNLMSINLSSVNENITRIKHSRNLNNRTYNEPAKQNTKLDDKIRNRRCRNHVKGDSNACYQFDSYEEDIHMASFAELPRHTRNECDNQNINKGNASVEFKTVRKHSHKMKKQPNGERNSMKINLLPSLISTQSTEAEAQIESPDIDVESNKYPNLQNFYKQNSHSDEQCADKDLFASNQTEPSNFLRNEINKNNANENVIGSNTINEYRHSVNKEFHLVQEAELYASKPLNICETAKLNRNEVLNELSKCDMELNKIPLLLQNQELNLSENDLSGTSIIYKTENLSEDTINCKELQEVFLKEVSHDDANSSFNRVSEMEEVDNKDIEDQSFENKCTEVSLDEKPYPDDNIVSASSEIKFNFKMDDSTFENASIRQQSPNKSDLLNPLNTVSDEGVSSMNPSMTEESYETIGKNIARATFQDTQCSPYKLPRSSDSGALNIYVDIGTQTCNNSADFSCQVSI